MVEIQEIGLVETEALAVVEAIRTLLQEQAVVAHQVKEVLEGLEVWDLPTEQEGEEAQEV